MKAFISDVNSKDVMMAVEINTIEDLANLIKDNRETLQTNHLILSLMPSVRGADLRIFLIDDGHVEGIRKALNEKGEKGEEGKEV